MTLAPRRVSRVNVYRSLKLELDPIIIVCGVPCLHASNDCYDTCNGWDWEIPTFTNPVMGSRLVMEDEQ